MLNYTYQKDNLGRSVNPENLFVNRFRGNNKSALISSSNIATSNSTFWKSPYFGDNTFAYGNNTPRANGVCIKPELSVNPSRYSSAFSVGEKKVVKSILKNKESVEDSNNEGPNEEVIARSAYGKMNLITTGTGKGQPYGTTARSRSAEKRVKFDGLPKPSNGKLTNIPVSNGMSRNIRRLQVNKRMPVRILGAPQYIDLYGTNRPHSTNAAMATLNGGESNIKLQISAFVKRLRLVESAKLNRGLDSELNNNNNDAQVKSVGKLRRPRCKSGGQRYLDWEEFDIEKVAKTGYSSPSDKPDLNNNTVKNTKNDVTVPYNVITSKTSLNPEDSRSSLESFDSFSEEIIPENTPGGAKIFRPKPMASLYTKYSHITTNNLNFNKYASANRSEEHARPSNQRESGGKHVTNFCDTSKTNQIIDWLQEVNHAQSSDGDKTANKVDEEIQTEEDND